MERIPTTAYSSPTHNTLSRGPTSAVERLIAAGKCKQAVELAKEEHRRCATPQSQQQLADAYLARIEQFQNKGMAREAAEMLAYVRQRFPEQRAALIDLQVRSAAEGGRVDDLVAPLTKDGCPPQIIASVEANIRQHLTDVSSLANCRTLPAEHPLRIAAAAIWRAFEAVTSGPISDEQLALPEVSRRSPLAPWKMLTRAIAAFHRHDDEGCRRALETIPADAAVAKLAPVLRAMMEGKPPRSGAAGALCARITSDDQPLREALEGIENALRHTDLSWLTQCIRRAMRACAASRPQLCERLRQHISIACLLQDAPVNEVVNAMGPSQKDAYFWRLLARVHEMQGRSVAAALFWERFLRHAVAEGTIKEGSLEAAMVYLHAAGALRGVSLARLSEGRRRFGHLGIFAEYYRDQPAEIAALAPRPERELVENILSPGWLFERAAEIHPAADTFRQWWAWAEEIELPDRFKEDVALRWHEKQPRDPQPLLILSTLAERRNALKLAITRLSAAETLDSLNPAVRRARARLTLAIMWRHFRENKPHLIEKDLTELAALPGMADGDRAGFVAALRATWHALQHNEAAAQREIAVVMAALGPLAGGVILESVAAEARLPRQATWPNALPSALPDPHDVIRAETRTIRLASEMELERVRPGAWDPIIDNVLGERHCPLGQADLLAIGRSALGRSNWKQAYFASSAGLASNTAPAVVARFLLLRGQALTPQWAHERAAQCLRAAVELARQAHDTELLQEVFAQVERHPIADQAIASNAAGRGLGENVLAEVLKREREAVRWPRDRVDADRHLVIADVVSPSRQARGPFDFDADDESHDEDDLPFEDHGPLDPAVTLPPAVREILEPLLDSKGRLPTPRELLKTNPQLLLELLNLIGGRGPDGLNELLDDAADEAHGGFFDRVSGRRRRKNRKRK